MAGPVMQQAPTVQLGRTGLEGGGSGPAPTINPSTKDDGTFDLLMRMGETVLAPMIQRRQSELFLQGAQRVAQGEALKDIVDEQPWYNKIFGESASIQGARTVAQVAQVDKFNADLMGNMEELAKLSPEEVGASVNKKMTEFLTGDPLADAVIQQKMVEASGTFYTTHAKAHYRYVQETMKSQVTNMMVSASGMFQKAAVHRAEGILSDKDWGLIEQRAASSLLPISGQSAESYWSAVQDATVDALVTQNHHFANMVFDSGLVDQAPAEVRKKLIDERRKYEAITREEQGYMEYGVKIGQLKGMAKAGVLSTNQIAETVDQWNREFAMKTGIQSELFTRDELTAMVSGNYAAIYKRQEANAKESMKYQQELEARQQMTQAFISGAGNVAIFAGAKKAEYDAVAYAGIETVRAKGGDWADLVVRNFNDGAAYVNPFFQNEMQAGMRAAKMEGYGGQSFDDSYAKFKELAMKPGGKATALKYLGDEDGLRMMKYDQLVTAGKVNPVAAYQVAFGEPVVQNRQINDKDVAKIIDKTVERLDPGFWAGLGGADDLTPSAKRLLTGTTGKYFDMFSSNLGMEQEAAAKQALDIASNEVDILGAFAYPKKIGQPPLSALIGSDTKVAGDVFSEFVNQQAKKSGIKFTLPGDKGAKSSFGVDQSPRQVKGGLSGAWERLWSSEGDANIIRGVDMVDPDTNMPYTTFSIWITNADGDELTIGVDSRELRKFYESHPKFK